MAFFLLNISIYLFANGTLFFLQMKFMYFSLFLHIKFQQTHNIDSVNLIFLG